MSFVLDPSCYSPILADIPSYRPVSLPSHRHRPSLTHQSYTAPESIPRSASAPHSPTLRHRSRSQNLREESDRKAECVATAESPSAQETHSSAHGTTENASKISLRGSSRPASASSVSQHSQFIGQPPLSHAATRALPSQQCEAPNTFIEQRPPPVRRYTTSSLLRMDDFHIRPHLPKLDMHMHIPHPQLHLPKIMDMHIPAFGEIITHLFAPNAYNATSPTANHPDMRMDTQGFAYDSMPEAGSVRSEQEIDRPHQRRGSTRSDKATRGGKGQGKAERVDSFDVHVQKRHVEGEHNEKAHQGEEREEEDQEEGTEMDGKGNEDGAPLCREAEIEKWKAAEDKRVAGHPLQSGSLIF